MAASLGPVCRLEVEIMQDQQKSLERQGQTGNSGCAAAALTVAAGCAGRKGFSYLGLSCLRLPGARC